MAAPARPIAERARRAAISLLAVALLADCTSLAPIAPADRVYSGRFAANVTGVEQRESVSGRFTLAVRGGSITIDLASPLGNTLARVQATQDRATLTAPQSDGSLATWEGTSPEALTERVLGWRLPVSGLADWIAGRPAPDRPARQLPDSGPAQRIEQDGWTITVEERFDESDQPRRLSLDRPSIANAPAVRLRLVVDGPPDAQATHGSAQQ
jgi:outer membrane lipoprotein LolB